MVRYTLNFLPLRWRRPSLSGLWTILTLALRVLGLHILVAISSHWNKPEPRKIILRASWWARSLTFLVHLVPVTVSCTLLWYNIRGHAVGSSLFYIGPRSWSDDMKLNALQVFAKIHELFIISSAATAVFHVTAERLIYGSGLPLGLLGASISFTQISWFWSPDFWGGFFQPVKGTAKFKMGGLLVVSGLIALLAGPSSAILMLPRLQDWSTTNNIFLHGAKDLYWPQHLAANGQGMFHCPVDQDGVVEGCLTAGYYNLLATLSPPIDWGQKSFGGVIDLALPTMTMNRNFTGAIRNYAKSRLQTWTLAPHLATCWLQSTLFSQWTAIYFYSRRKISATELPSAPNTVKGRFPVVRTVCVPPRLVDRSSTRVLFPVLEDYSAYDWFEGETDYVADGRLEPNAPVQNLEVPEAIDSIRDGLSTSMANFTARAAWVPLPDGFGTSTSGLAIMMNADLNSTGYALMGCSLDIRYTAGTTTTKDSEYVLRNAAMEQVKPSMASSPTSSSPGTVPGDFSPADDGTWQTVSADQGFFAAITPRVTDSGANPIEDILEQTLPQWFHNPSNTELVGLDNYHLGLVGYVEYAISTYVADVLSRIGARDSEIYSSYYPGAATQSWGGVYDDWLNCDAKNQEIIGSPCSQEPPSPDGSTRSSEYTNLASTYSFNAYAYSLQGGSAIFAIVILCLHMLVAVLHVMDLLFLSRWTVSCWDTLPELLALAYNSPGKAGLVDNTTAGIKRMKTYGSVARIGVPTVEEDIGGIEMTAPVQGSPQMNQGPGVVLTFDTTKAIGRIQPNVRY